MIHNCRWRLSLANGEPKYDQLEQKLFAGPVISVPTITIASDFDGPDSRWRRPQCASISSSGFCPSCGRCRRLLIAVDPRSPENAPGNGSLRDTHLESRDSSMSRIDRRRPLSFEVWMRRALGVAVIMGLVIIGLATSATEPQPKLPDEGPLPDWAVRSAGSIPLP